MSGLHSIVEKDSAHPAGIASPHPPPSFGSTRSELKRSTVTALASVLITSTVLMIIFHNRFWASADEGIYAHIAERILQGEVLHRDVQDLYAGYADFANAAAFSLFGVRLVSMRYPLSVLTVIQAVLMFLILRRRSITTAVVATLVLTSLSFVQFLNPTANWYALFCAVLTIAWLSWSPVGLASRDVVTGILLGTTFLFRQLSGVFLGSGALVFLLLERPGSIGRDGRGLARATLALIALVLTGYILRATDPLGWVLFGVWPLAVLAWAWRRTSLSNREVLALLRDLSLGGLISASPLLAYHLAHGALSDWFRDTFGAAMSLPTLGFMKRPGYLMMGILAWRGFHSGDLDRLINAGLYTCLLLISALLGVLLFRALVRGSRSSIHPLPVIATFYALVSLHYQLPIYLFYTVGLSLAAVLLLTAESHPGTRGFTVAVSTVIAGAALYYQAAMPLTRHLQGIVAGERRFPTTPLPSPVAGIYVDAPDAELYQSLVQLIDRETQPGDTIFALPMNAELYFLGRRTNPFRFYNTAVGVRSAADLDSVLQVMRCHPPKLVFYDPTDKYNTPASVRIAGTVRRQYEKLAPVPPFEVFRARRDSLAIAQAKHGCER
jgi:hypothetical protein